MIFRKYKSGIAFLSCRMQFHPTLSGISYKEDRKKNKKNRGYLNSTWVCKSSMSSSVRWRLLLAKMNNKANEKENENEKEKEKEKANEKERESRFFEG